MASWVRIALRRAGASLGLFLTLIALVAATTAVIAGTVGYTGAAATTSAQAAVGGEDGLGVQARTRVADDPQRQDQVARQIITEVFAPAPVRVVTDREQVPDGEFVVWTILPDVERLHPDDMGHYARGAEELRLTLRNSESAVRGLTVEGDLAPAAQLASQNLAASQALGTIPLSVLVLVTALAVVQVARLLLASREAQSALLVARGASRAQVFRLGAVEALLSVLAGGALGLATAMLVVRLVPNGTTQTPAVLVAAAACLAGSLLAVAVLIAMQSRVVTSPGHVVDRSGRTPRAVTGATLVLVLAAAALAVWQLDRVGSPLVTDGEGWSVDLVAGAAPALLLAAAGVVALGLLGPLSAAATAVTGRTRSAAAHLAATQVSRQLGTYAVPVVLTVLATGAATVAGTYAGTSAQLRHDLQAVHDGAPLRAQLGRVPTLLPEGAAPPAFAADIIGGAVPQATPVWTTGEARVGDITLTAMAAAPMDLAQIALLPQHLRMVPEQWRGEDAAASPGGSIVVPPGVGELRLHVAAEVVLDGWGLAYLNQFMGESRRLAQAIAEAEGRPTPSADERDDYAVFRLEEQVARLQAPLDLAVRLFVRDVDSGVGHWVTALHEDLPGPALAWDEERMTGFSMTPGSLHRELAVDLDHERRFAVDAVAIQARTPTEQFTDAWPRDLDIELTLRDGNGEHLLGAATADWASAHAEPWDASAHLLAEREALVPEVTAVIESSTWGHVVRHETNEIRLPPGLDASRTTWRIRASERQGIWDEPISAAFSPLTDAQPGAPPDLAMRVQTAMTPETADATGLAMGDEYELLFMNQRVPAVLDAHIDALPGSTEPRAVLVDAVRLGATLGSVGQSLRAPTQVWAVPGGDVDAAAAELAAWPIVDSVAVASPERPTDPTRSARFVFWVACAGAVLLASTGIAAAAATMTTARRSEVAVLRALGMPAGRQALSRTGELATVVGASVALGLAAGWLVSRLVVPALAQSMAAPGQVRIDVGLQVDWVPWVGLLAFGGLLVAVVLGLLARAVRGQALDREYREEVR